MFFGGGGGAPAITVAVASVTDAPAIGDCAICSVTVAFAATPSATLPDGTSYQIAQPDALDDVAVDGARLASRKCGPFAPAIPASTRFDPATPAFGAPAPSTSWIISTPFAADGVTP